MGLGVSVGLPLPPPLAMVNVGNTTCVFVGNKKRTVAVGSGVWVGVFDGVGVSVIICVGGKNWAVCVRAAAAVSKIMVSTTPGAGDETGDPTTTGDPQADMISTIPNKNRML